MPKRIDPELLTKAVTKNTSVMGVLRSLGLRMAGGSHSHISKKIRELNLDTSHFTGQRSNRGKVSPNKVPANKVLVFDRNNGRKENTYRLRQALLAVGTPYTCSKCSLAPIWDGAPLVLEIDHINGNFLDNRRKNLRFLCPNCHSQVTKISLAT